MKRILLAAAAVVALASPVLAGEAANWTGCYVGINGGYGWGHENWKNDIGIPNPGLGKPHPDGGMGGVQAGCDYKMDARWVVGLEGMFDWSDLKSSVINPSSGIGLLSASSRIKNLSEVTARVGYTFDNFMIYGRAGIGWSRTDRNLENIGPNITGTSNDAGWLIGAGLEWLVASNWSARIEFNHFDFGNQRNFDPLVHMLTHQTVDVVLVGLNYRFTALGR